MRNYFQNTQIVEHDPSFKKNKHKKGSPNKKNESLQKKKKKSKHTCSH